jgi:magnesium chelatase family protein
VHARERQLRRSGAANALLDVGGIRQHCALQPPEQALLEQAALKLDLSPRACHRVLKVARTIADLDGAERIGTAQLAEAIALRKPALGTTRSA